MSVGHPMTYKDISTEHIFSSPWVHSPHNILAFHLFKLKYIETSIVCLTMKHLGKL